MLSPLCSKDYEDRRRRQKEGIEKAKEMGKYLGRRPNLELHEQIYKLRVLKEMSIHETAEFINLFV